MKRTLTTTHKKVDSGVPSRSMRITPAVTHTHTHTHITHTHITSSQTHDGSRISHQLPAKVIIHPNGNCLSVREPLFRGGWIGWPALSINLTSFCPLQCES